MHLQIKITLEHEKIEKSTHMSHIKEHRPDHF